jgi:signal transduction histidine kinase
MKLPETPRAVVDLDLMKRLDDYAQGRATWSPEHWPGPQERLDCEVLHGSVARFATAVLAPLLNRTNSREMQTFTMHDSTHALKVAHLMWHILKPEVQQGLTPPEIAILVLAAHLHDLGMWLSDSEREQRLAPSSDLWLKLDVSSELRTRLERLERQASSTKGIETGRVVALQQILQAQEALLCQDSRERHATPQRYRELIAAVTSAHQLSPRTIQSPVGALAFAGDDFTEALVDVCVSHNQDAAVLLEMRQDSSGRHRFSREYPVGSCIINLQLVAATLRLADILDFDRERVPSVLFHFLLPRSSNASDNISIREWQKHLTISNWDILADRMLYRGRSTNPVAHHAVLEFCKTIQDEIRRTNATFAVKDWPFRLPLIVDTDIYAEGFRYLPVGFHLNEDRIFPLFMGEKLYRNKIVAIRELLQNAVDACLLRDARVRAEERSVRPETTERIVITYQEGMQPYGTATISVQDTGTGMDLWIIENYFLRLGESYYSSAEFIRESAGLAVKSTDFCPVAEFGIGFASCFMLADTVEVETCMRRSPRGDTTNRRLRIDGLGRLIHLEENSVTGHIVTEGTHVLLRLKENAPSWDEVRLYVTEVCVDIPFQIHVRNVDAHGGLLSEEIICGAKAAALVPPALVGKLLNVIIEPEDGLGFAGEISILPYSATQEAQKREADAFAYRVADHSGRAAEFDNVSVLTRGGFSVGRVPGLPSYIGFVPACFARLRLLPQGYGVGKLPLTDLARESLSDAQQIEAGVIRAWMTALLKNRRRLDRFGIGALSIRAAFGKNALRFESSPLAYATWLEKFSAADLYQVARVMWRAWLQTKGEERISAWEKGEGVPLYLGPFGDLLHRILLVTIMSKDCGLVMRSEAAYCLKPPRKGWKRRLQNWHSFVSEPVSWGCFAEYDGSISNLLYFAYPGSYHFSNRYRDALESFPSSDLVSLMGVIKRLVDGQDRSFQVVLSSREASLLYSVGKLLPKARVGSIGGSYSVEKICRGLS